MSYSSLRFLVAQEKKDLGKILFLAQTVWGVGGSPCQAGMEEKEVGKGYWEQLELHWRFGCQGNQEWETQSPDPTSRVSLAPQLPGSSHGGIDHDLSCGYCASIQWDPTSTSPQLPARAHGARGTLSAQR